MAAWIAVTGATGFIGKSVCRVLHAAGYRVRILARTVSRAEGVVSCDAVIQGDLDNRLALQALVEGASAVVHCAGAVRGASQADFDRVNVQGLANLVTAMSQSAPDASLFYLSSLAAREPQLSFYARSKHRSEQWLAGQAENLRWLALRPPAVYGPGDRELLPLFRTMSRGLLPVPGAGSARFSMVYVDDIARLVLAWLEQGARVSGVYTLDDGQPGGYSWSDVGAVVSGLCQRRVREIRVPGALLSVPAWVNRWLARRFGYAPMLTPEKLRELRHPDWVCDNRDLEQVLDWQPRYRLAQGLAHTPGWCARLR